MPIQRINIPHAKARGEWAELRFMTRAAELGLRVTKPWGDNAPYDFAIESAEKALALDASLERLQETDARAARVLELHYFAGLTIEQIAATLDVARSTIDRDWRFARAFLKDEIGR